jgi:YD repeat-containing protein
MRERHIGQSYVHLISFCCCVLVTSPAVSSPVNDLERLELHGAVHTVITKYPQLKTTHQFDREGRLTSLELVPTNDADAARYIYQYDESGRLIEEHTFEPDNTAAYRKLFRYGVDERGRQSAQVAVTENGQFAHAAFFMYDRRGLLTEELMISGQGVVEKSLYDVKGNLIYHARYFQGRLVLEASHHYDPLDRLRESRFYGSDGQLMRKDHYRYDGAGNRVEQTSDYHHPSHLRKSMMTYEFDHAGNWIKETIQRWSEKNGSTALTETVVSRERIITYY